MSPFNHLNSLHEHHFPRSVRLLWFGITTVLLLVTGATASESQFEDEIWPIFQERCIACHEAGNAEGQLRLDARQAFLQGGVSGVVFDRKRPKASLLLKRLRGEGDHDRMPLDDEPLADNEISLIESWLSEGAEWPKHLGADVAATKPHWAYVPPRRENLKAAMAVPWSNSPIDNWIHEKIVDRGLQPSEPAIASKRLRRLYFDLLGIPPTPEQIREFELDERPDAWERQVDRLLASPHYGQRWARHWLDGARYADSNGYQADQYREVWPYRDWVIEALNADMPFDQFTIEQLAGDLLPDASLSQRIATGFHRLTPCNVEAGVDPEENRVNQVLDRVNTTATVWLATTMECCQCHNHKYDPFTQREYYQLFAYFNNTPLEVKDSGNNIQYEFIGPKMDLPQTADVLAQKAVVRTKLKAAQSHLAATRESLLDAYRVAKSSESSPVPSQTAIEVETSQAQGEDQQTAVAAAETLDIEKDASPRKLTVEEKDEAENHNEPALIAVVELPKSLRPLLEKPFNELKAAEKQKLEQHFKKHHAQFQEAIQSVEQAKGELESLQPTTTLVMVEQETPRDTHVFRRGEFLNPGEAVSSGTPTRLGAMTEPGANRLALARWLVHDDNPLTARVAVNRWWGELLGRPLVVTTEDFGRQGDLPSHPEILDWLALELCRDGWSMKSIHRRLVSTRTYSQASRYLPIHLERDPENVWLSRAHRFRLPAETIRDNALTVSGVMSERLGGPPVFPPQPANVWRHVGRNAPVYATSKGADRYRRGVYVFWRRSAPYPNFVNFDAPDRASCTVQRAKTNTPLQALTLLNDEAYLELARHLGLSLSNRIKVDEADAMTLDQQRLAAGFERCTARPPDAEELDVLTSLLDEQRSYYGERLELAKQLVGNVKHAPAMDPSEAAAWIYVASTLLNLDETISRD